MEDPSTPIPSSLWSSLNSWFTSTVFFVLLNLMIATIVFTSNLPDNDNDNNNDNNNNQQQEEDQDHKKNPQIVRSPSILNRLKSFNLYPQRTHHDSSSEPHYHQHPLEVAATQYVFEQPDYQHFTSFINSDQTHEAQVHDTESRAEHVTHGYDFDQIHQQSLKDTDANTTFGFDPTRQETGRYKAFDFDPTRNQTHEDTGFDFDPTRKESRRSKAFDSDPTRNQTREDTRFDVDPTRKERRGSKVFDFDPTRDDTGVTRPEIWNNNGSGFDRSDEEQHGDELQGFDEVYSRLKGGGHDRTKSDGSIRQKAPVKMKKSASLKVGFTDPEEEEKVEARRPATVKEKRSAAVKVVADDDVEVDSRADDFINKFKNDLMLQRMESIIRKNKGGDE